MWCLPQIDQAAIKKGESGVEDGWRSHPCALDIGTAG